MPGWLSATHIVGGELNYRCLGNDMYEITLTVYRDCYNGIPWFDDPASIGIFDSDNHLVMNRLIPLDFMLNDTLDDVLNDECLVIYDEVCYHTTTYTDTVILPFKPGGYQLAYQRCCRNYTINNVPDSVGATYYTRISERALLECNTNARFKDWPPVYICVNQPIHFDHSAFDPDGDSIVYKMCTPLDGASAFEPIPQPPNPPPYSNVPWEPPYSEANMLGGVPLTIDPHTGLLTGVPNTIGQFVVGVCAEEYRDGELISVTRRDFQYNVGLCAITTSAFFIPDIQCGDLTVSFKNESEHANDFLWFFNDPANPGATSDEINPMYTYATEGVYTATLIVEPNTICADTSSRTITLLPDSLTPDFEFEYAECADSLVLAVTDLSTDSLSTIVAWEWTLEQSDGTTLTAGIPNPEFALFHNQIVTLSLTVTAENGCSETVSQFVPIPVIEDELVSDSLVICPGDTAFLNPDFLADVEYLWSPGEGLSDPTDPNPMAFPTQSMTYSVTISDQSVTDCVVEKSVFVEVPPPVGLVVSPDTVTCEQAIELAAFSAEAVDFLWATDPSFSAPVSDEAVFTAMPTGEVLYFVRATDAFGCEETDTVRVIGWGVDFSVENELVLCVGDTVRLTAQNLDPADVLSFEWMPESLILSGQATESVLVLPMSDTVLSVVATNQHGCRDSQLVDLVVSQIPPNLMVSPVADTIFLGTSIQLLSTQNPDFIYLWNPDNSLSMNGIYDPVATPGETTIYTLTVVDTTTMCTTTRTVTIVVEVPVCAPPLIFVPTGFTPNGDGKNDFFEVFGNVVEEMRLVVYDRWGEQVFEANAQNERWDGTLNGRPLPPDVYGYYLEVGCINGERYSEKGNVTLIR